MDFTSLFNMQGMMFCILALGWYLRKSGMIDKSGKALLSSLVMNVTLPASIVKSFQMEFSMNILKLTLEVIVISFLIQIFSCAVSGLERGEQKGFAVRDDRLKCRYPRKRHR